MKRKFLPHSTLSIWAKFNGIQFNGINIRHLGGELVDKGYGVIAESQIPDGETGEPAPPLMRIPRELILSAEKVWECAKADMHLREVLEAVGDFGQTDRGSILIFLLVQTTISSPDLSERIGVSGPWTEYVSFLPSVPLPTRWSEEEQNLLIGTSLHISLKAKLHRLAREYAQLEEATQGIPWCQRTWWSSETGQLSQQDWLDVDAWYRSRVLQLPRTGNAMVPCLDMANHQPWEAATAFYDQGSNGDVLLLLYEGQRLNASQELCINYGDKSASEMLFSYGFIDEDMMNAHSLTLNFNFPDNDPLKKVKEVFSKSPPTFRLAIDNNTVQWESSFIWLMCVDEDDGLDFKFLQQVDGSTELEAFWKTERLDTMSNLGDMLKADPMWELFSLRAISLLQECIEAQLELLVGSEDMTRGSMDSRINPQVCRAACALRRLEKDLMEKAVFAFQEQKGTLISASHVRQYLGLSDGSAPSDDDFS